MKCACGNEMIDEDSLCWVCQGCKLEEVIDRWHTRVFNPNGVTVAGNAATLTIKPETATTMSSCPWCYRDLGPVQLQNEVRNLRHLLEKTQRERQEARRLHAYTERQLKLTRQKLDKAMFLLDEAQCLLGIKSKYTGKTATVSGTKP